MNNRCCNICLTLAITYPQERRLGSIRMVHSSVGAGQVYCVVRRADAKESSYVVSSAKHG